MVKTEQVRSCQGLEKIRRNVAAMCNPHNVFFNRLRFKEHWFVLERDLAMSKNINFILLFSQLYIR